MKTPSEFPSDWHYEAHLEALAREIAGRKVILEQFEAQPEGTADRETNIERTKGELAAAETQLTHYTKGQRSASKRPKAEKAESR